MLRMVLEIFFAGQIIAEKLVGELGAKCETLTEKLKGNSEGDRKQNIGIALEALKNDCEQLGTDTQKLLQNLGDLVSAYVPIKMPLLECSATEKGNKKAHHKDGSHHDGAESAYELKH